MQIIDTPHPYLLIRDFYTDEEQALIWQELDFLTHKHKLQPPQNTGQGNPMMKKNKGIFLDNIYADRSMSNILKVNRKVFSAPVFKAFADLSLHNRCINVVNADTTLLSYYEATDHYKPHADTAVITALSWHFREPRHFEGGDLVFSDLNETILVENNMLIVFPSCLRHSVTQVEMYEGAELWKGLGRYCLSSFMNIK
jgi:hypothetical protein